MINTRPVFDKLQDFFIFVREWERASFEGKDVPHFSTIDGLYWSWDKSDCSEVGLALLLVDYYFKNVNRDNQYYTIEMLEEKVARLKREYNESNK